MSKRTQIVILTLATGLVATAARAEFQVERTLALQPGGTFTLETDIGDVTLTGTDTPGARVAVISDEDLDRDYDLAFAETPGGARVTIKRRGLRRWFGGWFDRTRITIQVPTRTAVRLSTSGGSINASRVNGAVDVHTSGGSLRLEAIEGNVEGTTSGGSIRVRDVRGSVVTSTSGGSIVVADVRGSLRASTSGGSVDVRGAGGRVEAKSSGGGVTVRFAAGNSRGGALSSSGGSVRTELDPTAKVSIDATASGGSVNTDLPVTIQGRISNDSLHGDLNGGGAMLRLHSSGGGVRISATSRTASR